METLLNSLLEETLTFEADVKDLEINVTSAENVTSELSLLLEQLRLNLTQTQELVVLSEFKLRVEVWTQLETASRVNRQLQGTVSYIYICCSSAAHSSM